VPKRDSDNSGERPLLVEMRKRFIVLRVAPHETIVERLPKENVGVPRGLCSTYKGNRVVWNGLRQRTWWEIIGSIRRSRPARTANDQRL